VGQEKEYHHTSMVLCPGTGCSQAIIYLSRNALQKIGDQHPFIECRRIWPISANRPAPEGSKAEYSTDYQEAAIVLDFSAKASAALSRRLLQKIIRLEFGITKSRLVDEIDEILKRKVLPDYLAEDVDVIRHQGNFAAHPELDTNSGAIIDVSPDEADWSLRVVFELLEFLASRATAATRRADYNARLAALGKKPLKQPPDA
jgi:hypothetical protein